jgi:hypothetical protein
MDGDSPGEGLHGVSWESELLPEAADELGVLMQLEGCAKTRIYGWPGDG